MQLILIVLISLPFLFYNLGATSLTPWDEAWYGEIARNIIKSGNLFTLTFNGKPYFDHPPVGFWIISISELFFGYNSIGVRVGSAFFGFLSLIILYFLGSRMFGKTAGFFSALALLSAPWFLTRARSGNLDIFLTFFFILTIYLALLAKENYKFIPYFFISLTLLFLTKTMVPFAIIPALTIIFWGSKKKFFGEFAKTIPIFVLGVGVWFYFNYLVSTDRFVNNYYKIGLTGVGKSNNYWENFKLVKTYVHNGIGNWFWPGTMTNIAGLLFKDKRFIVLIVLVAGILSPFVFSEKGHIWHMIPVYPFLILGLFGFINKASSLKPVKKYKWAEMVVSTLIFLYFFIPQMQRNIREFIFTPVYVSDEEILAREASKFPEKLILDDDFIPTVVFYSGKNVERTVVTDLNEYFEGDERFLMIVREHRLGNIDERKYQIIKKDRDKLLIRKNTN